MRAYINVWGNTYLIESVRWNRDGEISFISFRDKDLTYVVHQKTIYEKENIEEMRDYPAGIIYADLEKLITWEES